MHKLISFIFLLSFITIGPFASEALSQFNPNHYKDRVFQENIKTVLLYPSGDQVGFPAIPLNGNRQLVLRFDDLDADVKRYFYTIVHCDRDWIPSQLEKSEYIDGFDMEEIMDYEFSRGTIVPYTHYTVRIPNRNFRPLVSGNYVVQVYDPELRNPLVLSKRFVVYEPRLSTSGEIVRPANVAESRTHQEINFTVSQKNFTLDNPMDELRACVLQNGWWHTAECSISPRYVSGDNISFDYRGRIVFPGGRNFRPMDLRTTRFRSERVHSIEHYHDGVEIVMRTDDNRSRRSFSTIYDFNGRFVIENREHNHPYITSDYVFPFLTLRSSLPVYDHDVYVVGGFSEMEPRPEFRMEFDDEQGLYYRELKLKQGYYDYLYATSHVGLDAFDFDEFEGNLFETLNDYYVLLYFRPFGSRFDRIIGLGKLTNKQR